MVDAGLQALTDAENPTDSQKRKIARGYLWSYFHMKITETAKVEVVKGSIKKVKNFLGGTPHQSGTPHFYCGDTWLIKESRMDVAMDINEKETILRDGPDGVSNPVPIEDVKNYKKSLWYLDAQTHQWERNEKVPYWAHDLFEYVFDSDYEGKTMCTVGGVLAGTQDESEPATLTLCPLAFENKQGTVVLGDIKPSAGLSIKDIIPRSTTLYHELLHLAVGTRVTLDYTYSWLKMKDALKKPNATPEEKEGEEFWHGKIYQDIMRQNPDTITFFSVGYWYFMQTTWNNDKNTHKRWSFHTGAGEFLPI